MGGPQHASHMAARKKGFGVIRFSMPAQQSQDKQGSGSAMGSSKDPRETRNLDMTRHEA
jgi:hypothetical protein